MTPILIYGAHSDVGQALATQYAQAGHDLYLASRNTAELERLSQDLKLRHAISATVLPFDACDYDVQPKLYEGLNPRPEGVIVCFGYLGDQVKAQSHFEEARQIIETNYLGAVRVLELAATEFSKQQRGWIVGISSVAGDRGRLSNYMYGSAKAGLSTYLSGLRNRLQKVNVPVLTVKPGFMATKMTAGLDLPQRLTTSPTTAAASIIKAQRQKKDVVYISPIWRLIMGIITAIPERIFKRLSL